MAFDLQKTIENANGWEIGVFVTTDNGNVKLLLNDSVEIKVGGRILEGAIFVNKVEDIVNYLESTPGKEKQLGSLQNRLSKIPFTSTLRGTFEGKS